MQEVTCFHCNSIVHISPDSDRCSHCEEDLSPLLDPEYVSDYFYQRANSLATSGRMADALAETERGLAYRTSSDLHLLAAILARQLGHFDQMRQHVAEIPLGDILRPEAEWMVRSHQARQRALREGSKVGNSGRMAAHGRSSVLEDVLGQNQATVQRQVRDTRTGFMPAVAVILLVGAVVTSWLWLSRDTGPIAGSLAGEADAVAATPIAPAAELMITPVVDAGFPLSTTPDIQTEAATPTLVPTASVPRNLVQGPTETAELVDSDLRRVVVVQADIFDLETFLNETDNHDLAVLPIDARVQDGRLILQGIVHMDTQRRELLDLVRGIQGINNVNAVDLLLRPAPTYTVREGDTLWSIVYNIYGDVERMDDFYDFNTDVLPSRDAINVGMVLKVPPLE